jgi:cytochrome c-type biogenesis protein CcmH
MIRWTLLVAALVLEGVGALSGQEADPRVRLIAEKLRCPVCQNESVADSPSELAAQMRSLIRDKLAAGETEDQIIQYFASRYGEWILLEPPRHGVLWVVWLAPGAALLAGTVLVFAYVRRAVRTKTR